ncbi:MAG: right-handed parallel beta-helix repeat-containing protein [Candidatus Latescibacterota bacterium]|nr:MAG: right-handed parallel beta-helix repeat-containing protein [Candidatus Latescibacterota bacterium]
MDKRIIRYINWLAVFALVGFAACSDDETGPGPNSSPTIQFTFDKLAVEMTKAVTLTVDVSDPDDDPLTVTWAVTRDGAPSGSLNPADQGSPSMRWTAPAQTGRDTIRVVVSDGKGGTRTLVETIVTARLEVGVTVSQIWNKASGPYLMRPGTAFFVINERATLTVDPGVEIYIDVDALDVSVVGSLDVNGTSGERVVFRPNSRNPEMGSWQGITASPSGEVPVVDLRHTDILYAVDAIKANEVAIVRLDGCRIKFSQENAVLHRSTGELRVENCVITDNNRTGIRIKRGPGVDVPETVVISGDSIAVNGDLSGATPYDDDAGILIDIDDPVGTASIDISCNEISRNGTTGIQLANAVYPFIHHNAIFGNERGKSGERFNIRLTNNFGGVIPTIDARNNYWGAPFTNPAADSTTIKRSIRDVEDAAGITVRVLIYEWLNEWPTPQCP